MSPPDPTDPIQPVDPKEPSEPSEPQESTSDMEIAHREASLMGRRRFMHVLAVGGAAVLAGSVPNARAASPKAGPPKAAAPKGAKPVSPAMQKELRSQEKSLADVLKVVRDYDLPAGERAGHGVPGDAGPPGNALMLRDDVFFLPAAELGREIRGRRLSPVELTQGYLDRIRRHAPSLNAFATVTADLALEQARKAEQEISRGIVRGPLHGVPYGAKDLLATAGIPTTWGARPTEHQIFDHDATVIRRLRDAGAVLLGKTSMVEFAGCLGYWYPNASLQGPGRNPWNTERWTGGSSSGSGAAVAAGLVGFAIGTETWGSILCPSAFCGITGLRPTYGRVSRAGGMVGSWTLDKVGPLARSAEDCRLVLQAIAGADPDDPTAADEPVRLDAQRRDWKRVRAALIPSDFAKTKGAEHEVGEAFARAVDTLRAIGVSIEEAKLPEFPASETTTAVLTSEAISTFERFFRDGSVNRLTDVYAPYQERIARQMTGADYVKAMRMRRVMQEKMADFYGHFDVIVAPNFLSVAPPIDKSFAETLPYADPVGAFGNGCGLPAIALPCGAGKEGLPTSFQLMGSSWDEGLLLELGEAYQRRTAFHTRRPPAFAS